MTGTAPIPNLDLLDAVVAHIEAHPEQHNQGEWICGTAACVAGRTVLMSGWKPVYFNLPALDTVSVEKDGQERGVRGLAQELLGLDRDTANELFWATNTVDDIRRIRDELHAAHRPAQAGTP